MGYNTIAVQSVTEEFRLDKMTSQHYNYTNIEQILGCDITLTSL